MLTRPIGSLNVSVVGLGCNNFGGRLDEDRTKAVVHAALDAGITLFDTADIYGGTLSEEYLGKALGPRRSEIVLATKFGMGGGGAAPAYVRECAEASLRRLGTEWIDLYQLHAPDAKTPIAETLGALQELVDEGKVREIGCSNFNAAQIEEAPAFVSVQNYFSILHREPEDEVLPACEKHSLAFLPFFPLENGLLTGKVRAGQAAPEGSRIAGIDVPPEKMARVEALAELDRPLLELAFGWLLDHPPVASVIAGATTPEQIKANVAAGTASVPLPADLRRAIDAI